MVAQKATNHLQSFSEGRPKAFLLEKLIVSREKNFTAEAVADGDDDSVLELDCLFFEAFLKVRYGLEEVVPLKVGCDAGVQTSHVLADVLSRVVQKAFYPKDIKIVLTDIGLHKSFKL